MWVRSEVWEIRFRRILEGFDVDSTRPNPARIAFAARYSLLGRPHTDTSTCMDERGRVEKIQTARLKPSRPSRPLENETTKRKRAMYNGLVRPDLIPPDLSDLSDPPPPLPLPAPARPPLFMGFERTTFRRINAVSPLNAAASGLRRVHRQCTHGASHAAGLSREGSTRRPGSPITSPRARTQTTLTSRRISLHPPPCSNPRSSS